MTLNPQPFNSETPDAPRTERQKRFLLVLALAGEIASYIVLTQARYEGQGLAPLFFRLSTLSDLYSLLFVVVISALLAFAFVRPERMGRLRTVSACLLVGILLWLNFGIRHTPTDEFSSEAAIMILIAKVFLLAVLLTGSKKVLRPARKLLRIALRALLLSLLFMGIAFFNAFFFPTYSRIEEVTAFNADAAVVLGAAVWHGKGLG
ncbi:MAG TPA: hypothetical protein VGM92_05195, partial [Candidatus Kapabacteria bacterium]